MSKIAISILSGGLDSCVSTACAINEGYKVIALHFNYSQRTEQRELQAFNEICKFYNIEKLVVDMDFFKQIGGSSLTDMSLEIPKDELGKNGKLPNTYVPFRNGIFYSIAAAVAQRFNASAIYTGLVSEDSSNYPDTTLGFVEKTASFIKEGSGEDIKIITPLIKLKKSEIVKLGMSLKAPLELSYSCYDSNDLACGKCESCQLRLKGFSEAGFNDLIKYQ
ncbi:7-cyano-7-deazaguanine synthase QueC [Campylobacter sp. RM12640]|uniref:7-cyano-7-deazaguanine synthase QueC n=1 Tax=unclassified Campylobacter TaxID=2593542 RepID=UPI00301439C9|nr:7-cyano-7-deazaguanine synthase QueC [Campylobacter sp. RM12640]MBZ7988889.1 7-cyano-7-deazaguanine synthase QueC [Campylobacter sp. RM12635]